MLDSPDTACVQVDEIVKDTTEVPPEMIANFSVSMAEFHFTFSIRSEYKIIISAWLGIFEAHRERWFARTLSENRSKESLHVITSFVKSIM